LLLAEVLSLERLSAPELAFTLASKPLSEEVMGLRLTLPLRYLPTPLASSQLPKVLPAPMVSEQASILAFKLL
jgi:hypothetical protein